MLARVAALSRIAVAVSLACFASYGREVQNLDGAWKIVFDPDNRGRREGWQARASFDDLGAESITVPSVWETLRQDYEGVAWYRKQFAVPASWEDRFVRLRFGAVNYRAEVWVNEHPAGFHEGGYTPFEIRVGDLLRAGRTNTITVRVVGPIVTQDSYIDGFGRNDTPHWRGSITGGIWQPVTLIAGPPVFVRDVFVEPDLRAGRAVVNAKVINAGARSVAGGFAVSIAGRNPGRRQAETWQPGETTVRVEMPVPDPQLWSPDRPYLYTAEVDVDAADETDSIRVRFGMREFTMRGDRYYLNGKSLYLKAGFWEGFYPHTLAFPRDVATVRREIALAKEAGFNVLRPWRKPPPPPILDLADEMGIMVIGAPPIECMNYWPSLTPETEKRVETEVREMVLRDRNHPSVICWELFNEIVRSGLKRLKREMSIVARELDPTRMVVDESGGWAGGAGAYLPHSREPAPFNELHLYLSGPVNARIYDYLRTVAGPGFDGTMPGGRKQTFHSGKLTFISEVGYGGWPDFASNVEEYRRTGNPVTPDYRNHAFLLKSFQEIYDKLRWRDIFPDLRSMFLSSQRIQAEANKLQLEALRLNPATAGYCLHAFTDGDWVVGAGVLDLFRNQKLQFDTVKLAQRPLYLSLRLSSANLYADRGGETVIESVNEGEGAVGTLRVELGGPDGARTALFNGLAEAPAGIRVLKRLPVRGLGTGVHRLRLAFERSGGPPFENTLDFYAGPAIERAQDGSRVALLDPEGKATQFLSQAGFQTLAFDAPLVQRIPVVVTLEKADSEPLRRSFAALVDYVRRGGVAILLRPPLDRPRGLVGTLRRRFGLERTAGQDNALLTKGLFPFRLQVRDAIGHWVPVNHAARPHPIFEGVPLNGFLGQIHQNLVAAETILGLAEPPIVGSLAVSIDNASVNRDYRGYGPAWWGADMALLPYGNGRFLVTTMPLCEQLGQDPLADRVVANMVRWAAGLPGQLSDR